MAKRNLIVGLFVLAGIVLFSVGLFLVGNGQKAFDKHMEVYTEFKNLSGLAKGAKVRVSGFEAGDVTDIGIPNSPDGRFRIKMKIDSKLRGLVRADSRASIETEGVVGNTYLLIKGGSSRAPEAANLSTLPSKEPFDLSAVIEQGTGVLNDAGKTIRDVDRTIQQLGGSLNTTLGTVDGTVRNVNDVVTGIKQGRGAVGLLLRNQQFAGQVQQVVASANQATGSLAHASSQADQMISDLQARNLPQKVDQTLDSAKSAAAQLDATSKQVNQTLAEATAPDSQGVTAGVNLRDSLTNVNNATANLADDTESLKHEFFFKGFFKKRGYYELSDIDPDAYRRDKLFANAGNQRFWLPASELFEPQPDGTEQLSMAGKTAIDDAVGQNGGAALEKPLVVEGYGSGDAAEQVALSRKRAIVVTRYLENHFQIDSRKIGFVALNTTPPPGVGHSGYSGVSIVVLPDKRSK